jgi:anti-anti-sigma regulatory factor
MFKISIVDSPAQRRLVVEGKLSGPWVAELRSTCKNASRVLDGRKLVIDLSSLTVISREGEDAILDLMKDGAKFSCAGILTRHVLKRLARRCRCEPDHV